MDTLCNDVRYQVILVHMTYNWNVYLDKNDDAERLEEGIGRQSKDERKDLHSLGSLSLSTPLHLDRYLQQGLN